MCSCSLPLVICPGLRKNGDSARNMGNVKTKQIESVIVSRSLKEKHARAHAHAQKPNKSRFIVQPRHVCRTKLPPKTFKSIRKTVWTTRKRIRKTIRNATENIFKPLSGCFKIFHRHFSTNFKVFHRAKSAQQKCFVSPRGSAGAATPIFWKKNTTHTHTCTHINKTNLDLSFNRRKHSRLKTTIPPRCLSVAREGLCRKKSRSRIHSHISRARKPWSANRELRGWQKSGCRDRCQEWPEKGA